jgi:hypothetical protein
MSGFPRDLAVLEPWELSLLRQREGDKPGARAFAFEASDWPVKLA